MLASVIAFGLSQGTFDLVDSGTSGSTIILLGFLAGFAVKAPLFPFHGWLPDAYRESSPEVAAVLSWGVISKAAMHGFLRIACRSSRARGRPALAAPAPRRGRARLRVADGVPRPRRAG